MPKTPEAPDKLPNYISMSACAAATGIPLGILKKAAGAGCPAIKRRGVRLAELLPWIFTNLEGMQAKSPRERLAEAEAQLAEQKVVEMKRAGLSEAEDIARKVIAETLAPIAAKLRVFPMQLSSRCNPSDPALARQELEAAIDEILKQTKT